MLIQEIETTQTGVEAGIGIEELCKLFEGGVLSRIDDDFAADFVKPLYKPELLAATRKTSYLP